MKTVRTKEELAKAVDEEVDTIVVEGDMARKVVKIKATGKVAWAVAIGGIAVAVVSILTAPETAGTSAIFGSAAFAGTASVLGGIDIAMTAVGIAVAAGGVEVLNSLRKYSIAEKQNDRVVLRR